MNLTPLRILQVNSLLRGGGTDDQCIKLARGLHELGQRVWLAGPDGQELSKAVRAAEISFRVTPDEGLMKTRFIASTAKFIRHERIQIVHGHHGRDLWPTILAARLSGVKPRIVLTRHMAKSPSSWFSRRFLLSQCDAIIAVSNFVARVLREGVYEPHSPVAERRSRPPLCGDTSKIHLLYGGIDTDGFQPSDAAALRAAWGLAREHYAFAMIGSYDLPHGKGQREFLQAAANVHASIPRARFLIVGRGNMAELLRSDICRLKLEEKAWLTPYCHDMPQAMNAIDCLVHSQIATEAMPGVVCEAQACGRPVIASDLDGIPEAMAMGGEGQLVKPGSEEELSAALIRQANLPSLSPEARNQMHARVAETFSLRLAAERVLALYRKLQRD